MSLQMKIADEKEMVILALEGQVDSSSVEELNHGLDEAKRRDKKKIILLLRDLESFDSQGISPLVSFLGWAEQEGREVKMAEVRPGVLEALKVVGIDTLAPPFDSLSEAMKNFRKDGPEGEMEKEEGLKKEEEFVVDEDFRKTFPSERSKMPLFFIAGGVFLFLLLLIIYMTRDSSSDLQPLEKKMALIEQKVALLEGQGKEISGMSGKLESMKKELTDRSQHLEKELARLRSDMESAQAKVPPAPPAAPSPAVAAPAKPPQKPEKYHTVAKGETLFGISKKYGLSLDELRRLNNLKPGQSIAIGQKLVVGSP
jgi:anti-anti-sigma factor